MKATMNAPARGANGVLRAARMPSWVNALSAMSRELERETETEGKGPLVGCSMRASSAAAELLCVRLAGADVQVGRLVACLVRAGHFRLALRFFADEVRAAVPHWTRSQRSRDEEPCFDETAWPTLGTHDEGVNLRPSSRPPTTLAIAVERVHALELVGLAEALSPEVLEDENTHVVLVERYMHRYLDAERPEPLVAAALLTVGFAYECRFEPDEQLDTDDHEHTSWAKAEMYARELVRALQEVGDMSSRPFDASAFIERLFDMAPHELAPTLLEALEEGAVFRGERQAARSRRRPAARAKSVRGGRHA